MPDCVRIHPSAWFSSSETKNIRSASFRCAIEKIASARLARRRVEQALDVERLAFHPRAEPGRGEQVVERHRELEAILRREERLEVEHADPS